MLAGLFLADWYPHHWVVAAVQVVTFAILEGFRVKAYEKTGEVRVEHRSTGCGRNMHPCFPHGRIGFAACVYLHLPQCVAVSAPDHRVTRLLLLLRRRRLLHAWLPCAHRCQAS